MFVLKLRRKLLIKAVNSRVWEGEVRSNRWYGMERVVGIGIDGEWWREEGCGSGEFEKGNEAANRAGWGNRYLSCIFKVRR